MTRHPTPVVCGVLLSLAIASAAGAQQTRVDVVAAEQTRVDVIAAEQAKKAAEAAPYVPSSAERWVVRRATSS